MIFSFGRHHFWNARCDDLLANFHFESSERRLVRLRVFKEQVWQLEVVTDELLPGCKALNRTCGTSRVKSLGAQNNKALNVQFVGFGLKICLNFCWISND
ncbi:hypothetical protein D3C72_1619070 [compost metagenome]